MKDKETIGNNVDIACSLLLFLIVAVPGFSCGWFTYLETFHHDPNRILFIRHLLKPFISFLE